MCDQGGEKQLNEAAAPREDDEADSPQCTSTAHQDQRQAV